MDSSDALLVKNLFSTLHPNFGELSSHAKFNLMAEKLYVEDKAEVILDLFNKNKSVAEKDATNADILRRTVNNLRGNEFFQKLHPDFELLTDDKKKRLIPEKTFIEDYLPEIDEVYQEYLTQNLLKNLGLSDFAILRTAVDLILANKLFDAIYPHYKAYTKDEKFLVNPDLNVIKDHTEEFVYIYEDLTNNTCENLIKDNNRDLLKEALAELKKRINKG